MDNREESNIMKKAITYDDLVKKWHRDKKTMYEMNYENPIRSWSNSKPYELYPNAGKAITDSNPYVNMVSVEEFDLFMENEPYQLSPPPMTGKMGKPDKNAPPNPFLIMHKEVTGDPMYYMKDMGISIQRTKQEITEPPKFSEKKELNLKKLKEDIIKYANSLGFISVGVTKVDRRYISEGEEHQAIFENIILLGYEMPRDVIDKYPNPSGELGAFGAYAGCARNVHKVADMIRENGYDCRTLTTKGEVKYPPLAVNAGLGNYSTYGVCVTPEAGTRLKYCSVLIDADIEIDLPRDFNIEEFCSRCRMCQKSCPTRSIPKEESRHKGSMKRQTRYMNCLEMMTYDKECLKCVRVCPFSIAGFDTCMDSLPSYYKYNLDDNKIVRGVTND